MVDVYSIIYTENMEKCWIKIQDNFTGRLWIFSGTKTCYLYMYTFQLAATGLVMKKTKGMDQLRS